MDLLFVYGTLRSEFDNPYAVLLRERGEFAGKATIKGSIYRVGNYPGYWPEPPGTVQGEVYGVNAELLRRLDEYEGEQYQRVTVDGMWVYQYHGRLTAETRIASGDYCAR